MQISKSNVWFFWIPLLIVTAALFVVLQFADVAADCQTDSAHGNTSFGVDRKNTTYAIGDCANCHDTFDESICGVNGLMLFDPPSDENFCFDCHDGTTNYQETAFSNYNYAKSFGGGSIDFSNVKAAFNASGSAHDLVTVLNWVVTNHAEWGFTSDSNPCLICHNHHIPGANQHFPADPTSTCIRRPGDYAILPGNLWGDDLSERMNTTWSTYQPPYYKGGGYEPGGGNDHDGNRHPDYATLCLDCHSEIAAPGGYCPDGIDWKAQLCVEYAPPHGEAETDEGHFEMGYVKSPWSTGGSYVLSCLDCHEPHGSINPYLLRTTVNGTSGLTYDLQDEQVSKQWCGACHTYEWEHFWADHCHDCHTHGEEDSI